MAKKLIYYAAPEAKILKKSTKRMRGFVLTSYLVSLEGLEFFVPENHIMVHPQTKEYLIEERYFDQYDLPTRGVAMLKDGTPTDIHLVRQQLEEAVKKLVEFYEAPFDATSATAHQRRFAQGWAETEDGLSVSKNSILAREAGALVPSQLEIEMKLPRGFAKYFLTSTEFHHVNKSGRMVVHICKYKTMDLLQTPKVRAALKAYKELVARFK